MESVLQHADLAPQDRELAALAAAVREVLALDALPAIKQAVQP